MKIFIHGLESSGKGFKGRFFKEIFPEILTPDFRGELFERMSELKKILKDSSDINYRLKFWRVNGDFIHT